MKYIYSTLCFFFFFYCTGTVYLDLYPREGKYRGAGHFVSRCGHCLPGEGDVPGTDAFQLPVVALLMNFAPPERRGGGGRNLGQDLGEHALLSHYEVETMFHEFGHALHSLLSRTRYQHLSGTNLLVSTLFFFFEFIFGADF